MSWIKQDKGGAPGQNDSDALEAIGKCRSGDAARLAKEASGVITETTTHLAFLMDELPVKP